MRPYFYKIIQLLLSIPPSPVKITFSILRLQLKSKLASSSWTNHSPRHTHWNVLESSLITKIPDETKTGMLYPLPI